MGEKIWKSFAAAAVEQALKILDGADITQIQRYGDLLGRNPLYQEMGKASRAHEREIEAKQLDWLRKKAPQE